MGKPDISSKVKVGETKAAKDPLRTTQSGTLGNPADPRKKHVEYREHALRSRTIKSLQYGRHDAKNIVQEAIKSFAPGIWSEEQRAAKKSFKDVYVGWHGSMSAQEAILHMIDACSQIFFMGKLDRNNIEFEWDRRMTALGSCSLVTGSSGDLIRMKMNPKDHHEQTRDRSQRSGHIGTLLHKLCHAFVILFSCGGECKQFQCVAEQSIAHGDTGHAEGWFVLATFVQIHFRRMFPELDVRLGIFEALFKENEQSRYVPGSAVWDSLFDEAQSRRKETWEFFAELNEDGWERLEAAYDHEKLVFHGLRRRFENLEKKLKGE